MASSIEKAIEQLESSAQKLRDLSVDESKAVKEAVKEATKEAKTKVKAEYADKKKLARQEAKEAEKAIKDAQLRIQKALGAEPSPGKRAKKGERDAQMMAFVKDHPGSKLAEIARGMGVQGPTANGVAKRLVSQKKLKKSEDKTYTVA